MNSHAYLSGVSLADICISRAIYLTGYASHWAYISQGVYLIVLRACISQGVHARGSHLMGVCLMGV